MYRKLSISILPYRAKLCRAKFSSGEIIRRAKFWSLSEKFVTFARRKIRNLSYFMLTQYDLYISAPSKNYSSGEIFVGRNYSSGEIFVIWRKIRHFRPTKFRPMFKSSFSILPSFISSNSATVASQNKNKNKNILRLNRRLKKRKLSLIPNDSYIVCTQKVKRVQYRPRLTLRKC